MEQRPGWRARLAGATTVAIVGLLLVGVVTPTRAEIRTVNPSSGTVTAGQSINVTVTLDSSGSACLGGTSPEPSITVGVTPACNSFAGVWVATATISTGTNTPPGQYSITLTETAQEPEGSGWVSSFALTVEAAPDTTTTTTQPEGTTTTTDPSATTTTAPPPPTAPTSTTTVPATTTTAATTTTQPDPTTTQPPAPPTTSPTPSSTTTHGATTSTPVEESAPTTLEATTTSDPTQELAAAAESDAGAPGAGPEQAAARGDRGETFQKIMVAAPPAASTTITTIAPAERRSFQISLRALAEAIPGSIRDLVASPFLIALVILGAIRDTGAATIWPLLLALVLLVDWKSVRRRLSSRRPRGAPA